MPKKTKSYKAGQLERLKDPAYAAEYINAAMEADDSAAFLLALRNVAETQTINTVANQSGLSRESVYRILSESGNPCYTSLLGILGALGLRFKIQATSKQTVEAEAGSYLDWKGSSLLWEMNDCPPRYSFQRFEDLTYDFTQLGPARVAETQAAPMLEDAPDLLAMVA